MRLSKVHEYCSKPCRLKGRLPEYFRRKRERYATDDEYRNTIVDKARLYRAANPDKVRESNQRHIEKPENRARAAAASRDWHAANRKDANRRRQVRKQEQRIKRPWSVMFLGARKRAKDAGLPFDLTDEWGESRWTGRCELTDIPFVVTRGMGTKPMAASLDRIIPALGYVKSNCRFILFCVNAFKHSGTDEQMYAVANALITQRSILDDGTHQAQESEAA